MLDSDYKKRRKSKAERGCVRVFEILDRRLGKVAKTWNKVRKKASHEYILRKSISRRAKHKGSRDMACLECPWICARRPLVLKQNEQEQ